MMRRSQTWRVIYTRWDKTVNGGGGEVYAASWFYKVDITIYSKEYAGTGGLLIFKADCLKGNSEMPCPMWHILYHDNKHYNSV
jgi:hypothetical protein